MSMGDLGPLPEFAAGGTPGGIGLPKPGDGFESPYSTSEQCTLPSCGLTPPGWDQHYQDMQMQGMEAIAETLLATVQILQKIEDQIADDLHPGMECIGNCCSTVVGECHCTFEECSKTIEKQQSKVMTDLLSTMTDLLHYSSAVGVFPSTGGQRDGGYSPGPVAAEQAIGGQDGILQHWDSSTIPVVTTVGPSPISGGNATGVLPGGEGLRPVGIGQGLGGGGKALPITDIGGGYTPTPVTTAPTPAPVRLDFPTPDPVSTTGSVTPTPPTPVPIVAGDSGSRSRMPPAIGGDTGVGRIVGLFVNDWCSPTSIDAASSRKAIFDEGRAYGFGRAIGTRDDKGNIQTPTWIANAIPALAPPFTKSIATGLIDALASSVDATLSVIPRIGGCDIGLAYPDIIMRGLLGFISQYTGVDFGEIVRPLTYDINFACPTAIMSAADCVSAYLSNALSHNEAAGYARANGLCPPHFEHMVQSSRAKFDALESAMLRRRGLLTEDGYNSRMRKLGWLSTDEINAAFQLTTFIPGPSDLVSFMTRDVFDEAVVKKYRYDEDFTDKFTAQAKEWAAAQGMTESQFKYFWRAHWQLPSPTQAYEMVHRLRPGAVPAALEFTLADAKKLLEINDYAPAFQERLIAISYAPLTRVDTQRAFFIGTLSRDEVKNSYLDLGYAPANAERLTKFTERLKQRWLRSQLGLPSPSKILGLYADDLVSDGDVVDSLMDQGFSMDLIDQARRETMELRKIKQRKRIIAATKSRYLTGDVDRFKAANTLSRFGVSAEQTARLMDEWEVYRDLRGKSIPAMQLCKLFTNHLISEAEYGERLVRIGYRLEDAAKIVGQCQIGIDAKGEAAMAKAEKERVAAAKKAAMDQEKRREKAGKLLVKAQKDSDAARKAMLAAQERQDKDAEKMARRELADATKLIAQAKAIGASVRSREDAIEAGKLEDSPGPKPDEITGESEQFIITAAPVNESRSREEVISGSAESDGVDPSSAG